MAFKTQDPNTKVLQKPKNRIKMCAYIHIDYFNEHVSSDLQTPLRAFKKQRVIFQTRTRENCKKLSMV